MAEADSTKLSVVDDSGSETTMQHSTVLARGENVHQRFTNSIASAVAGDQIHGAKNVYNNYTFIVHCEEGSERQPGTSGPAATQQDCSNNAPEGEGWVSLTDTVYTNNLKPIKKGYRVYEGKQKLPGYWRDVAIKFIDYDKKNFDEIKFMCDLESHPNVVKMYEAGVKTNEAQRYIYIVMQRCPKTLNDFIKENDANAFQFDTYFSYAKQIVKAIEFIHRKCILHRDIKPDNILVFPHEKNCRISDFGLSKQVQDGKSEAVISSKKTFTEGFEAPEIHGNPRTYSERSDSFAIGIVLYMLFSGGAHPYGADVIRRRTNIIDDENKDLSSLHESMKSYPKKKKQLLDLIQNLISHDPKKRSKPKDILKHPFFQDLSHEPQISSKSVGQENSDSNTGEYSENRDVGHTSVSFLDSEYKYFGNDHVCGAEVSVDSVTFYNQGGSQNNNDLARTQADSAHVPAKTGVDNLSENVIMLDGYIREDAQNIRRGKSKDGMELAIKLLDDIERSQKEIDVLKTLNHENIVQIIEVGVYKPSQTMQYRYIAMERHPENLADYIKKNKGKLFNSHKPFSFSRQLVTAVAYLHGKCIVHRDLKPGNVLVAKGGEIIKLTDMGLSRTITPGESKTRVSHLSAGTDGFKAPETYDNKDGDDGGQGDGRYAYSCDIFPLAININYIFSNGNHPFGNDPDLWVANIKTKMPPDLTQIGKYEKRDCLIRLLKAMLNNNRKERPTADRVLEDRFFQDGEERPSTSSEREMIGTSKDKEKCGGGAYESNSNDCVAEQNDNTRLSAASTSHELKLPEEDFIRVSMKRTASEHCGDGASAPAAEKPMQTMKENGQSLNGAETSRAEQIGGAFRSASQDNRETKPRSRPFIFSKKITSDMDPIDMMTEIKKVLDNTGCEHEQRKEFKLVCKHGYGDTKTEWKMEVCRLPRMKKSYGVRFKHVSGTGKAFENITSRITDELKQNSRFHVKDGGVRR